MKITNVSVRLIPGKARLRGIARIVLDGELAINDIKVIETSERLCVEFPKHQFAKKRRLEYIVPLSRAVRERMEAGILEEYHKEEGRSQP